MKTIAKISEESLKLVGYIQDIPNGQILTFDQIERDTKINMDAKGKTYLRTACRKLKREYSPVIGIGIELASAKSATGIVSSKLIKIDRAVIRGEKTYHNVSSKFYDELAPQEQKQINFIGAVFGAIRVAAKNGKNYLKSANSPLQPILPENIK